MAKRLKKIKKRPSPKALCFRAGREACEAVNYIGEAWRELHGGDRDAAAANLRLASSSAEFVRLTAPSKKVKEKVDQLQAEISQLEKGIREGRKISSESGGPLDHLLQEGMTLESLSEDACGEGLPASIPALKALLGKDLK